MPNFFDSGIDDFMFPTTRGGMRESGMILESAAVFGEKQNSENGVFESANPDKVEIFATQRARSEAMGAVLAWIEDGEFDYNTLDEIVVASSDLDGDFEISEAEEAVYSGIWEQIPDALISLGADEADVNEFFDGPGEEADKAAARIGAKLSKAMDEIEADDDAIITGFALGEDAILESCAYDNTLHGILEATYKNKIVVHNGEKMKVKKRIGPKQRLSAAEKQARRKGGRKAHTASANIKRQKSLKKRESLGL